MKLRTIIIIAAFTLGVLPLFTLVSINLTDHISRHEQVSIQSIEEKFALQQEVIQSRITSTRETLLHLTTSLKSLQFLPCLNSDENPAACTDIIRQLENLLQSWQHYQPGWQHIVVFNRQGKVRFHKNYHIQTSGPEPSPLPESIFQLPASSANQPHQDDFPLTVSSIHAPGVSPEDLYSLALDIPLTTDSEGNVAGVLRAVIDARHFIIDAPRYYLADSAGNYLNNPATFPSGTNRRPTPANVFKEFPGIEKQFAVTRSFLREEIPYSGISWMSLTFTPGKAADLYLGMPVDRSGAREWKAALIENIIWILSILIVIVFIMAHFLAVKIDRIKDTILAGVSQTLEKGSAITFQWSGPRELQTLAKDLTSLSHQYAEAGQARRRAENELIRSETKFRNLTKSAKDAIIMVDHQGMITFWNQAARNIFGFEEHEAFKRHVYELIAPRMAGSEINIRKLSDAADGPISETLELSASTKSGGRIPIELSLSEARVKDQYHSIWIIRDLTERKLVEKKTRQQQQQLIQADKMISLGLLVSGVAHEINNPNSIIMLNSPMLSRSWQSIRPILEEYYQENGDFSVAGLNYSEMRTQIPKLFIELEESAKRIKNIVNDLKDYARQDTTKPLDLVDINDIVRAAVRLTYNRISKTTAQFSVHYGDNLPAVRGHKQRLEQVLINLLQNSYEALENDQAAITLTTGFDDQQQTVVITVQDEGHGVKPEHINTITDPFFTTKRNVGGTGLGLSVSAGIVKEHNGIMKFHSTPGKGTTVQVTLPAAEREEDLADN